MLCIVLFWAISVFGFVIWMTKVFASGAEKADASVIAPPIESRNEETAFVSKMRL